MSVLEMTEFPNNVQLPPKIKGQTAVGLEHSLPLRKNRQVPSEFLTTSIEPIQIEPQKPRVAELQPCVDNSRLASFCPNCRRSFLNSMDFQKHTNEKCKVEKELKFLVSIFSENKSV
jgi:hypothetical protein